MRILMSNCEYLPPVLKWHFYSLLFLKKKPLTIFIIMSLVAVLTQADPICVHLRSDLSAAWSRECCTRPLLSLCLLPCFNQSLQQKLVKPQTVWMTAIICHLLHLDVSSVLFSMFSFSHLCRVSCSYNIVLAHRHFSQPPHMWRFQTPVWHNNTTWKELGTHPQKLNPPPSSWFSDRWRFIASWEEKPMRPCLWCQTASVSHGGDHCCHVVGQVI